MNTPIQFRSPVVAATALNRGHGTERFVGANGDLNASSQKDLFKQMAAFLEAASRSNAVTDEVANNLERSQARRQALTAAFNDAGAHRELGEVLTELHAGREQLAQDIDSARLAHELGQQQARAQAEALQLAEQRLGWIQRAVRAGQLSAPEQWRAQSELHEARSQAQRAQLEAGRAHSRYLQAIGALP